MKKMLEFVLSRPRLVIATALIITLITGYGITLFEYDNSEKNAMPYDDTTYQLGEETKKLFGDSSTFLIAAIEPAEKGKLLTRETFQYINGIANEVQEYRTFNRAKEDLRLATVLESGNVKIAGPVKISDKEKELQEGYDQPYRPRNRYDYSAYRAVSMKDIASRLDNGGRAMMETIIEAKNMKQLDRSSPMDIKDYKILLESWEDIYLLKSVKLLQEAVDPISITDINGEHDELKAVTLIPKDKEGKRIIPSTPADFAAYKKRLLRNPAFKSNFYSMDDKGEIRALAMSMMLRRQRNYDAFTEYGWAMFNKHNNPHSPVKVLLQGSLVFNKVINEYNEKDMGKYLPIAAVIMLIVFYLNFKSIRGMALPILSVFMGSVWTMGILGFLGIKMTILTAIIPPLLMAIGSAYAIHVLNQYYIDLDMIRNEGRKNGLMKAMLHILNTVLLTGLATFVSFLTLTTNTVRVLVDFGIGIALGTVLIIVISIVVLPAALAVLPIPRAKKGDNVMGTDAPYNLMVKRMVDFMAHLSTDHYKGVVIVVLISIVVSVFGIMRLKTETSATTYFKPDSYIRKSLARTNELFEGSYVFNIVFSPGEGKDVIDAEFLKYIDGVQKWLSRKENRDNYYIRLSTGFNDYIKRMNKAINNEKPEFYTIPNDTMTIMDFMEIFSGDDDNYDGRPDMFESTLSKDYNKTVLYVRMGSPPGIELSTARTERTLNHVKEYLDSIPNPKGYTHYIVGGPVNFVIIAKYINNGQIQGMITGILSIGIIMFLIFRSWQTGLSVLVPMVASIVWIFGFMGWAGIPFGMTEALISPIAIGIGIDDACHILNMLRKKGLEGIPIREAITQTHHETGLAIVYTSMANSLGSSVLIFSSFMPVFRSGLLICAVLVISTLSNLILFPSAIMLLKINVCNIKDWKIFRFLPLHKLLIEGPEEEDGARLN
ncbi:MAG: hypothetical protein CVV44_17755 [Spirochaetae bacterium HGW-Spirochaetae-1]|jgi:hypothetical protein|nr:MAG: hypothetical protein CVV44_17755 [Spirochaetae bacterium HGW-Spirochaetae-1]